MKTTTSKAGNMIAYLLERYTEEIESAYLSSDDPVTISLKVQIEPGMVAGDKKITANISFVESRVKDKAVEFINEAQKPLPGDFGGEGRHSTGG